MSENTDNHSQHSQMFCHFVWLAANNKKGLMYHRIKTGHICEAVTNYCLVSFKDSNNYLMIKDEQHNHFHDHFICQLLSQFND